MSAAGRFLAGAGLTLAIAGPAHGAPRVTFVVTAPASTPAGDVVWVSGDHASLGAWNGAGLALARAGDGTWRATLELPAGTTLEFKVTRGDWNRVEKDAAGGEIANRAWTVRGDDTVRVEVKTWRDQVEKPGAARASTITGTVQRLGAVSSKFVATRDVIVWLPPGYADEPTRRYPVVYFLDGQNVFDGATSFIPGEEWGADEAADRLIRAGLLPPCLLVAVANTSARMDEYTLARDEEHGGGKAALHQRFVLEELKPRIDREFRTRPDAAHTGVVGSSLGGLAALDLLLEHPQQVGMAGCVSPAVWWAGGEIVERVRHGRGHPGRVWLDIGTAESTARATGERPWMEGAQALHAALVARGWRDGADLHYEEIDGARHNEAAWRARVDRVLLFLLAPAAR
jgi:predicted alpha/beta superfamily hydrolase